MGNSPSPANQPAHSDIPLSEQFPELCQKMDGITYMFFLETIAEAELRGTEITHEYIEKIAEIFIE